MSKADNVRDFIVSLGKKIMSYLGEDSILPQEYENKIEEVYEAGKQAEYDRHWDNHQNYGNRRNYHGAFAGSGWNRETFVYPKYPIILGAGTISGRRVFEQFNSNNYDDLIDISVLNIDWSPCTDLTNTFADAGISNAGFVDCSNCSVLIATFNGGNIGARSVQKVLLKVHEKIKYSGTFGTNRALTELYFTEDSVIGENLDISWSAKLIHDSLISIIGALKNLDDGVTRTLTINTVFQTNGVLSDAEKQIAIDKGWSIAYVQR